MSHHPVLDNPWTYNVTELHIDFVAKELVMTRRKGEERLKLRFMAFQQLSIDEGYTGTEPGMEILDFSASGVEFGRVRVQSFEEGPALSFWAEEVKPVEG